MQNLILLLIAAKKKKIFKYYQIREIVQFNEVRVDSNGNGFTSDYNNYYDLIKPEYIYFGRNENSLSL